MVPSGRCPQLMAALARRSAVTLTPGTGIPPGLDHRGVVLAGAPQPGCQAQPRAATTDHEDPGPASFRAIAAQNPSG